VVLTNDKYILFDTHKSETVKALKHSKKEQSPLFFEISSDDKFSVELHSQFPTSVIMRNLVSNQLVAKFDGHSQNVSALTFSKNSTEGEYCFVSVAGTECLLWQAPSH